MCDDSAVASKGAAGAPEVLIGKHRGGFPTLSREADLPTERDVVAYPLVNVTKKIIEIMRGYKTRPNNFIPL